MSRSFILLFCIFLCTFAQAQDPAATLEEVAAYRQDTAAANENYLQEEDTAATEENYLYEEEEEDEEDVDLTAPRDSTAVTARAFSPEQLEKLRSDPELQYEQVPTIAESLWDRFWRWIEQLITSFFENATGVNIGRMLLYVVGIALVVVLIMMLLKVNAFKIFYSGQGATRTGYNVIEENIHEMDFETLIQQAVDQKDYRRGVRLVFLYALKLLSDKHLIDWQQGKTNHDYVAEVSAAELKKGLNELSIYFDYAWYGNFTVSPEMFSRIQGVFTAWKANVR